MAVVKCYNDISVGMYSNIQYGWVRASECVRKFYFNLIFKEKTQTYSFVRVGNIQERCYEYL